jgi:hypothetical protein
MEEPGADGKLHRITNRKGVLIYTPDSHMSVQVMYPKSESAVSNDYVQNGYKASFGSYDVNEGEADGHTSRRGIAHAGTREQGPTARVPARNHGSF